MVGIKYGIVHLLVLHQFFIWNYFIRDTNKWRALWTWSGTLEFSKVRGIYWSIYKLLVSWDGLYIHGICLFVLQAVSCRSRWAFMVVDFLNFVRQCVHTEMWSFYKIGTLSPYVIRDFQSGCFEDSRLPECSNISVCNILPVDMA
jgi:hypothetical protein